MICLLHTGDTEMYSYDNAISKYFGETLAIKYNEWVVIIIRHTLLWPHILINSSGILYDVIDFCVTQYELSVCQD